MMQQQSSEQGSKSSSLKWRALAVVLCVALCATAAFVWNQSSQDAYAASKKQQVKILFTHDIHSFLAPTKGYVGDDVREHGGAARLATLIKQNTDDQTVYLDAGDFSQGTLFQAGYETNAYELSMLGELGCAVTTLGNHEWDHAGNGLANMLNAAKRTTSKLPQIVMSNLDFSGELTQEQYNVQAAFQNYGVLPYTILDVDGVSLGVFGVSGENSIEDSPTSGMKWQNYIEAAQSTVAELSGKVDMIVCLSHSGTEGDGETGEDFLLAEAVPEIDVIISAHSHSTYKEAIRYNDTYICSAGEYLSYLGSATFELADDGTISCKDYELIPVDESVEADEDIANVIVGYKQSIEEGYLAAYGASYDEVICSSPFDFMSLSEMYETHQEYPMGDLIADSYRYAASKVGVDDIDVALVGLGTIRGSFFKGEITTADAFEICSLGVGSDGSAGHPLLTAYVTGEELKLLVELDASLGPLVNSIKMSYSGLSYTFNEKRAILDRVVDVHLTKDDGTQEEIVDDKLYKVCCNMYAANMLGMLNSLTAGILKIEPKYADGSPVQDFYTCAILDNNGRELKEWVAFREYLMSFDKNEEGISEIPSIYQHSQNRKVKQHVGGLAVLSDAGLTTIVLNGLGILLFVIIAIVAAILIRRAVRKKPKERTKKSFAERQREIARTDEESGEYHWRL